MRSVLAILLCTVLAYAEVVLVVGEVTETTAR
jgi:hypothetical protein